MLQDIFPEAQDIHFNYSHPTFVFEDSLKPMIFDIFIPSLKVAFEYQGEQHFHKTKMFGESEIQSNRDSEKKTVCQVSFRFKSLIYEENGITYFSIPYWWDGSKESLRATINSIRFVN